MVSPAGDAAAPGDTRPPATRARTTCATWRSGTTRRLILGLRDVRVHPRRVPAAGGARRHLQRHESGPARVPRARREADHLPRLGGPGDPAVRDASTTTGGRPRVGRLRRHPAVLPPLHDARPLPLPVRPASRRAIRRPRSTSWTRSSTGSRTAGARDASAPGERSDHAGRRSPHSASSRSTRSPGATQQRPQQQLPLHRLRQHLPSERRPLVHAGRPDPPLHPPRTALTAVSQRAVRPRRLIDAPEIWAVRGRRRPAGQRGWWVMRRTWAVRHAARRADRVRRDPRPYYVHRTGPSRCGHNQSIPVLGRVTSGGQRAGRR